MDIGSKLEAIRKKPEHVRERYTWIAVGVCMLFIIIVWLISFKDTLGTKKESDVNAPVQQLINESKEALGELPNIEDIRRGIELPTE